MMWRTVGMLSTGFFLLSAAAAARGPDPLLWVVVFLSAAYTGVMVAAERPVPRWVAVILVVFPAELALVTLLFEPAEERALARDAVEMLTRRVALQAAGMLMVAGWAAMLAITRPNWDENSPEL